jgi:AbrB family looped-hinge helix DNA binding protein
MLYTAHLTQKGQVTIPQEVRKKLGLLPREKVAFVIRDDEVLLKPAPTFLSLYGSVKAHRKYTDDDFDQAVLKQTKKNYVKKG